MRDGIRHDDDDVCGWGAGSTAVAVLLPLPPYVVWLLCLYIMYAEEGGSNGQNSARHERLHT